MIPTYRPYLGAEELEAVRNIFQSRWVGMGPVVEEFERRLAAFLGVQHVIAVNSGTAALHLALEALGLDPEDEVLLPSFTFVASAQVVKLAGAKPVFCEVRPDTLNMDLEDVRKRITEKTRVIMPVHFGGLACSMDEISDLGKEHALHIVEDAAHAFGSCYKGRMIGTLGDMTCFSFDPIKNITCCGGGAVATDNDVFAERVRLKRYLGIDRSSWQRAASENAWYYDVVTEGFRYHMDDMHAAIGLEQLKRFALFKIRKQQIVCEYDRAFSGIEQLATIYRNPQEVFPFGYFIRILNGRRDELIGHLKQHGIATRVQFVPNHLQSVFAPERAALPVTEKIYNEILTLPAYYEMTDTDVQQVIEATQVFFCGASGARQPYRLEESADITSA